MSDEKEDDVFLDQDLNELNKIIQSASDLFKEIGGNPMTVFQKQFEGQTHQQVPVHQPPQPTPNHTILHVVNKSNNPLPQFQSDGASGFDFQAFLPVPVIIKPMTMGFIPTGLYVEVEPGYEIQARSRSGIAFKSQVFVLNSPGTIDSDYRGEISIMLFNLGPNEIQVNSGDRIAQGVICPVMGAGKVTILSAQALTPSNRGAAGFGSTGVK